MWPVVRWPQLGEVAIVQSVDERGEQVLCRIVQSASPSPLPGTSNGRSPKVWFSKVQFL
jgi:hypothetical protein